MSARRDPRSEEGQQFTPVLTTAKVLSKSVKLRESVGRALAWEANAMIDESKMLIIGAFMVWMRKSEYAGMQPGVDTA